jgi:hypothetical protein
VYSIIAFGLLMGMRHALEADHLAAVASLALKGRARATVLRGAVWGVGHTCTLLLVGGACLLLGTAIPSSLERLFEAAVGAMLVALGIDLLRRMRRERLHVHVHRHPDGVVHLHAHRHLPGEHHDRAHHDHAHAGAFPRRALLVGMMHGMAGSAALLLLTLQAADSVWLGLAYIALFGAGSIVGMAVLSMAIVVPVQMSAARLGRAYAVVELLVALATTGIGLWTIYQSA